jgi:hypothetical protein
MVSKSVVAALILTLVLAVFSVLSFTIWHDVPHIIYMQSIITVAAGISLMVLFAKQYEWRMTPNMLNPIQILKRVANWNMLDSTKMALATISDDDNRLHRNIDLIKKYPFNVDHCNRTLVLDYQKGYKRSNHVPTNQDEVNLAKVMSSSVNYNPYKLSYKAIEQVINDTCHNGVNMNDQCWNVLKNLMKSKELNHFKDIYMLIDCITNYNPVVNHKKHMPLTNAESILIDNLWSLVRDPNHHIRLNITDLSPTTLLKFYDHIDLLDRVFSGNNPKLLVDIKEAIRAVSELRRSLMDKLPLFMVSNEGFTPSYSITHEKTKPSATIYKTVKEIRGRGSLSDPELASIDLTTDVNRIFYDNENVHYDGNLLNTLADIEIDKQALLSSPYLNPVLKSFIRLFKQKTS